MIEIEERLDMAWPASLVWAVLSNPEEVVKCVDGAAIGESAPDGSFPGSLTVRFGPLKVAFTSTVRLDVDSEQRRGQVTAAGKDRQGGTRVRTNAEFHVLEAAAAGNSVVEMRGHVELRGQLASVIESGASAVVSRMTEEFTARLRTRCAEYAALELLRSAGAADEVFGERLMAVGAALAGVPRGEQGVVASRLSGYLQGGAALSDAQVEQIIDSIGRSGGTAEARPASSSRALTALLPRSWLLIGAGALVLIAVILLLVFLG